MTTASVTANQIGAILQAQRRSMWNRIAKVARGNIALTVVLGAVWYGIWVFVACTLAIAVATPGIRDILPYVIGGGLLMAFLYWQVLPLLTISTGSSLELNKLMVYPVPPRGLFGVEVLLRLSTGVEIIILLTGASIGSLLNPRLPKWSPIGYLLFIVFNVLLAAGIRDAMARLLTRRHARELVVFIFVLLAALPQLSFVLVQKQRLREALRAVPVWFLPWTSAGDIASGTAGLRAWVVILTWIAAAYFFGRWQFDRSLAEVELQRPQMETTGTGKRFGRLLSWPSALFRDPLGGLAEKEIRVLARAPRFRLSFVMGFSFGLIIWAPMTFQSRHDSWMRHNFLAVAMIYAVMLLADVLYWNIFGVDRAAAQSYFVYPVSLRTVILAKNVATGFFTALDVVIVLVVSLLVRIPFTAVQAAEALGICAVIATWLLATGNLVSAYNPRGADLSQAFRRTSGMKVQWFGLIGFLVSSLPVSLAYLARFAFDTEAAFFATLAFMIAVGIYVWWLSVETADRVVGARREAVLTALSRTGNPIEP